MVDCECALQFVQANGTTPMPHLAAHAMGRLDPASAIARLSEFQNDDGGWTGLANLMAPISTTSSAIMALHWLSMMGAADESPFLDKTVDFLSSNQKAEGYWDEPEEIAQYSPKSWMLPGNCANQLWFTAAICRYLLDLGRGDAVNFKAALDFLRSGWDGERFPAYPHTHWMALALLSRLPSANELDEEIAQGSEHFLLQVVSEDGLSAGEMSEIAYAAFVARPRADALFERALAKVQSGQGEDGGWLVEGGDLEDRVIATVQALYLLRNVRTVSQ